MTNRFALFVALLTIPYMQPGIAEAEEPVCYKRTNAICYVSPDGREGWWKDEKIKMVGKHGKIWLLSQLTRLQKGARNTHIEIRLLTQGAKPWQQTEYFMGKSTRLIPISIFDSTGTEQRKLVVRGQRIGTESPLTRIVGLSLKETICGPLPINSQKKRCRKGKVDKKVERDVAAKLLSISTTDVSDESEVEEVLERQDILDVIGDLGTQEVFEHRQLRALKMKILSPGAQKTRINCVFIDKSSYIDLVDLGFRNCWLPGVFVADSHHVNLRGAYIEGSSYAFFVMSTKDMQPSKVTHFEITDSVFIQSPSQYPYSEHFQNTASCNIRRNLDCPADIWSQIPWGVIHDRIWEPLNGALMGARDIGGNVVFARNTIEHAYNGIRLIVSGKRKTKNKPAVGCIAKVDTCLKKTNVGIKIRENTFRYIRDNPVEPETYAVDWIVAHNRFMNSHAWISTDQVGGGPLYVFGNRGWFQVDNPGNNAAVPSQNCDTAGWENSPKFRFSTSDHVREGYYIPKDDGFDPNCISGTGGTVIKTEGDGPYLNRLYVFNNSWYLRSPVLASGSASPLRHWNNAIHFAGCGYEGHDSDNSGTACRIVPWGCGPKDHYHTPEKLALFAACFEFEAGRHQFDYDAVNKRMPRILRHLKQEENGIEVDQRRERIFEAPALGDLRPVSSKLMGAGCKVKRISNDLECVSEYPRPDIGALQGDGRLYDPKLDL